MLETVKSFAAFAAVVAAVGMALWAAHWVLIRRHPEIGNERLFPRQLGMLGLSLVGLLVCVLALPVSESSRNQLIGLIGILISGMLAFSSTTVISNLMAGVLLRITKPFRVGDFIRIGDHFGRVTERGLFETEIQAETRELISLPNTYCISNPVATIRSSGTIISATLSLGYDTHHQRLESLLIKAAEACGLAEPFVHILELGDFAVTYRVSGFLEEPKRLISARSALYASVLDTLHGDQIEIMSPGFMNQRKMSDDARIIPPASTVSADDRRTSEAEDIAFDKAEQAETVEMEKQALLQELETLRASANQATDEQDKSTRREAIAELRERLASHDDVPKVAPEPGQT